MSVIPLDRRFVEWTEQDPPDPDFHRSFGLGDVGVGWDDLLRKRRVVILAEAGSGKSTEMKERVRIICASSRRAFYATAEDVADEGLDGALSTVDAQHLAAWRISADEAWFLIDSIDEAKSRPIKLDKVLRKLAGGLRGSEERAHVVLSGRISDWEFRKDLSSLKHRLPISSHRPKPARTWEEELVNILRLRKAPDEDPPVPEDPFIVVMAPLDRDRVRRFLLGKKVPSLTVFLDALESEDLWQFARRPLDLDWLAQLWSLEGKLGRLAEMVERSVVERLKEKDPDRARQDVLDEETALRGLERIGAAMVFGRRATIAIPDGEATVPPESSLKLSDVLPDWPEKNRALLLSRAVFDPATRGRVRLHNDNEGTIRSFLAARWLLRLRAANLSTASLFDLLFAKSYDLEVTRPSSSQTAAWLSLWDKDVSNELLRRDPLLLFTAGDPGSLSPEVRRSALQVIVNELAKGHSEAPWVDRDLLRRFAQPDLGCFVASLLSKSNAAPVLHLLLRIAWLGQFKDCSYFAKSAALDDGLDVETRVLAGRALLATGDELDRVDYAAHVMSNLRTLPNSMVCDAVEELFPIHIGVQNMLKVLEAIDLTQDPFGLPEVLPRLVEKLSDPPDLKLLLAGLLEQIGGGLREHAHYRLNKREEACFPALARAARRLLEGSPPDDVPTLAVDGILRVRNRLDTSERFREQSDLALAELHRTAKRRRSAFWHAAHEIRCAWPSREITCLWQLESMGYSAGLKIEDIGWLIEDGRTKSDPERRLAVDAVISICRSAGSPSDLLEKIASATTSNPIASEAYHALTVPPEPTAEQIEEQRRLNEIDNSNASQQAANEQSWIQFIRDLRADAQRIARLAAPEPSDLSADFRHLFRLLSYGQPRYAIDSIALLQRIAGCEVASEVQKGLINLWRNVEPQIRGRENAQGQNHRTWGDLMGLAGVSLEAASTQSWVTHLSPAEASRAAEYATLEINGFPIWLSDLAERWPTEVRGVLCREILDEITRTDIETCRTLGDVVYAGPAMATLVAPALLNDFASRDRLPNKALVNLLHVIASGIREERVAEFTRLGIERFQKEMDVAVTVLYLAAVFSRNPQEATRVLAERAGQLGAADQAQLFDRFLSATFGDPASGRVFNATEVPPFVLEELVRLSIKTHGQTAPQREPVVVYTPNEDDDAYQARNALIRLFVQTPGPATYRTLRDLQKSGSCGITPARLGSLAEERAIRDSDLGEWPPGEAFAFEQHHETAPRTAKDLQSLLLQRLEDMQHDLIHDDFGQGPTLKALPGEVDVQKWIADRLRLKQGRSFSVEREPHSADEKEPDLRIRAKETDASVAVEIKLLKKDWTLSELDDALETQLCGRYLRSNLGRHGVLLLVHQEARKKGWQDPINKAYLTVGQVVDRLSARAAEVAGAAHDSPQPAVALLDVSSC